MASFTLANNPLCQRMPNDMMDYKWSINVELAFLPGKINHETTIISQTASITPNQQKLLGREIDFATSAISSNSRAVGPTTFTINEKLPRQSTIKKTAIRMSMAKVVITDDLETSTYLALGNNDGSNYSCDIPFPNARVIKSASVSVDKSTYIDACQPASENDLKDIKWDKPKPLLWTGQHTVHFHTKDEAIRTDGSVVLPGREFHIYGFNYANPLRAIIEVHMRRIELDRSKNLPRTLLTLPMADPRIPTRYYILPGGLAYKYQCRSLYDEKMAIIADEASMSSEIL